VNSNRLNLSPIGGLALGLLLSCAPVSGTSQTPVKQLIRANEINLYYERFGPTHRPTVLLVAGTGMQLTGWPDELVGTLVQRGYGVVRFDNRDVGLSTHLSEAGLPDATAIGKALQEGRSPPLPYSLRDLANDAVGLMDALEVQQAHVVGVSMGGAVAQLIAIDFPERVQSLTLLMSDSGNPTLPLIAKPEAFADLPALPSPDDREAFIEYQARVNRVLSGTAHPTDLETQRAKVRRDVERAYDPAGLVRQQTASGVDRFLPGSHRLNGLRTIRVPTVVVQGTADPLQPLEAARDLTERIPAAQLQLVDGLGHDLPVSFVAVFADAVTTAASARK
jgi:pimeloyl-ACP methyl ester carboxylesterase